MYKAYQVPTIPRSLSSTKYGFPFSFFLLSLLSSMFLHPPKYFKVNSPPPFSGALVSAEKTSFSSSVTALLLVKNLQRATLVIMKHHYKSHLTPHVSLTPPLKNRIVAFPFAKSKCPLKCFLKCNKGQSSFK